LSNFIAGFVVKNLGYDVGFLMLASIALAGLALFRVAMPETRQGPTAHTEAQPLPIPEVIQ
jgi:hypothetical protein